MTFQVDSTGLGQRAHLPLFPGYSFRTILACEQALCLRKGWENRGGEGSERVPSLSSQFFHPLPKQRACSQVKILKDQWNTLSPDRCITKCVFRGWLQAICTAPEMIPTPKWYPNLKWSPNSTPKWYRPWNDPQLSSRRPGNDPLLICTEQALFLHVQDTLDSE